MHQILRGAIAGLIATGLMTIVITAGQQLGLLRTPPPTQVTTRISNRLGTDREPPQPEFTAGALVVHAGFGAVAGAVYTLIRPLLPDSSIAAGLLFGGAVWGITYSGVLPALNVYPQPGDDRGSRVAVMIAAHGVYGVTLAEAERRLTAR